MTDNSHFLPQFLGSHQWSMGTLSYNEARGFLFAIACAPDLIKPSEWLPLILHAQGTGAVSVREVHSVIEGLIDLYNEANRAVLLGQVGLPKDITIHASVLENVGEMAALGQWSRGFYLAHDWLIELWHRNTPKAKDDELASCLMVLSFFSSKELAEAFYGEFARASGESLEEFAQTLLGLFEIAMNSYAHLGRRQAAQDGWLGQEERFEEVPLVGRDDPCPCGSGRKFRECCLH